MMAQATALRSVQGLPRDILPLTTAKASWQLYLFSAWLVATIKRVSLLTHDIIPIMQGFFDTTSTLLKTTFKALESI
jgi:hypothetical protein